MGRAKGNIEKKFYAGNHTAVLEATLDSRTGGFRPLDLPYIIGALCFLGRTNEALHLYQKQKSSLQVTHLVMVRFFLGVAFCRHSEYQKSVDYFAENLLLTRNNKEPQIAFFAHQGVGFYRYFCGRYEKARRSAQKALLFSIDAKSLYGKFLASDLIGHALVQSGKISSGLDHLENALKFANLLGDGGRVDAIQIAICCYKAKFGLLADPLKILINLQKKVAPQNSYSHSALLLEIARQLSLCGRVTQSQDYLDEACRLIYRMRHKRQGALLNIRYAYNLCLCGSSLQALNLLRATKTELDPKIDIDLNLQVMGFEYRLLQELGFKEDLEDIRNQIISQTHKVKSGIGLRILRRMGQSDSQNIPISEDILGLLLDQGGSKDFYKKIISSGYLTLLRRPLNITSDSKAFYLDLVPEQLVILDGQNIRIAEQKVTLKQRTLLQELSNGERSKETLVQLIWGYSYHPMRHDPLLYSTVFRLRKSLGKHSKWIEATESGYKLAQGVDVLVHNQPLTTKSSHTKPTQTLKSDPTLNLRQAQILRYANNHESIDAKTCMQLFEISRITATRDLTHLVNRGELRRQGSGRATKYTTNVQ